MAAPRHSGEPRFEQEAAFPKLPFAGLLYTSVELWFSRFGFLLLFSSLETILKYIFSFVETRSAGLCRPFQGPYFAF